VIGNPPYMKIPKDAPEAVAMPSICYGTPNMYFIFAAMSLFNLQEEGEMVYIMSRSWTSGAYFKRFREYFLTEGKIVHIHLFVSRKNIFDQVYKMSTEVQTMTVENLTTQTMDAQYLTSVLDIKYRVSASNAYLVFKQFRTMDNMSQNLIIPTTQRVLEMVTTQYNVIDILGESRTEVYNKLEAMLTEEFAKYGVEFYAISITDMDAGEALEQAITDEAVVKKAVETAEQNLLKAQTEAKQQSVQAQAKQDAARIEAETKLIEAEAEKQANELLNQSLTDEILRMEWINKWNGQMPTYYGGSDSGTGIIFDATTATETE